MPQSLAKILLHLTFSTKNRARLIPQKIQAGLHAYLAGACRGQGSEAYRVGGTEDHVHIACTFQEEFVEFLHRYGIDYDERRL